MKKLLFFLLLPALLLASCGNNNAKKIVGSWRLQNSNNPALNSVLVFTSDGSVFNEFETENIPDSRQIINGSYEIEGDDVTVKFPEKTFDFTISWTDKDEFAFSDISGVLIFARLYTQADHWQKNYENSPASQMGNFMDASQAAAAASAISTLPQTETTQPAETTQQPEELCYVCHGTKRCVTCKGLGTTTYYGETHECSACSGTGICSNCSGTGYEPLRPE